MLLSNNLRYLIQVKLGVTAGRPQQECPGIRLQAECCMAHCRSAAAFNNLWLAPLHHTTALTTNHISVFQGRG